MNYYKLDKSSKILLLISLIGLIFGCWLLYKSSRTSLSTRKDSLKIGMISKFKADTRLKRSDNMNWYPVAEKIDLFDKDFIFTGDDSFAVIDFVNGHKITIEPNSLMYITDKEVSLDSGSMEVSVAEGKTFKVISFGEKIEFSKKAKFKVVNDDKFKKIIPLDKESESLFQDSKLAPLLGKEEIRIIAPGSGAVVPMIGSFSITLEWSDGVKQKQGYRLDLSRSKKFSSLIASIEVRDQKAEIPIKELGPGLFFWRVVGDNGQQTDSFFYLTEDFKIKYNNPLDNGVYDLAIMQAGGINFDWENPTEMTQVFQVAKDSEFKNIFYESQPKEMKENVQIRIPGTFFWRVGYRKNELIHWFDPLKFKLETNVKFAPLALKQVPQKMDFSISEYYEILVEDLNGCDTFKYTISENGRIVSEVKSKDKTLVITRLKDGDYDLKVTGLIQNTEITSSGVLRIPVRNSPPARMPKIKEKKIKLFVDYMRIFFDWVIPTSFAAEESRSTVRLSWVGEKNDQYHLEIYDKTKLKKIVDIELRQSDYDFTHRGPGIYYWRVRSKTHGIWGKFTDFSEIEVSDRVGTYTRPLMIDPPNGSKFFRDKKKTVELTWDQPNPDHEYILEIFTSENGPSVKSVKVSKGRLNLKTDKLPQIFWWRVFGKSAYGNSSVNTDRFKLELPVRPIFTATLEKIMIKRVLKPEIIFEKPKIEPAKLSASAEETLRKKLLSSPSELSAHLGYGMTSSTINQKPDKGLDSLNKKSSVSGHDIFLYGEYASTSAVRNKIWAVEILQSAQQKADQNFKVLDLNLQRGTILSQSHHIRQKAFAGLLLRRYEAAFEGGSSSAYQGFYLSGRYNFSYKLNEKISFQGKASTYLQLEMDFITPSWSLNPSVKYSLTPNWSVAVFADYRSNLIQSEYSANGSSGKLQLNVAGLSYGLMLVWNGSHLFSTASSK